MRRQTILVLAMFSVCFAAYSARAGIVRGIDIDFVTIGNPGNPGDTRADANPTGCGSVDYIYRIGKYEITNAQWDDFVTAAGAPTGNSSDPYPDPYDESPRWTGDNVPTGNVSWYEAAQFCNYLTSGDKSQGAYEWSGDNSNPGDFLGIDRDSAILTYGCAYVIPTEDEWYKAAYYTGSGYSTYANGTYAAPIPGFDTNYNDAIMEPWNVGIGTEEQNGTFDMMGNVWEWNEMLFVDYYRGLCGGSYWSYDTDLSSSDLDYTGPWAERDYYGFRVASVPGSVIHNATQHTYYATIQDAVDDANEGDTIVVQVGTYSGDGNRDIDFQGKAITVRSEDPNDPNIIAQTIIDCNGTAAEPHRGFYFHSGEDVNSIVDGFTITNGYAGNGGGICCNNSSPTLTNCTFSGNSADLGGGTYCDGDPVLVGCTFSGNSASLDGGGMYNESGSYATLLNCVFNGNSAARVGGGICDDGGITTLTNCLFAGNSATECGGGISEDGSLTLANCTFSGNSAASGGAICGDGMSLTIVNSIVWANTATNDAQIALTDDSEATVLYSDLENGSGGVYDPCDGLVWGEGNIDADPLFVDPNGCDGEVGTADDNFRLILHSPCVDAGDPCYVADPYELDVYGGPRVLGGRVDIGADEYNPPVLTTDIHIGGMTNMKDYAVLADKWSDMNCSDVNDWCGGADVDKNGKVNIIDLLGLAENWLTESRFIRRGTVTVDGVISDDEWADADWIPLDTVYSGHPNDVTEAFFALRWNELTDKVYAAIIVKDNDPNFRDDYGSWDASDRLEVYSQGTAAGGSGWGASDSRHYDIAQHYCIAPGDTVPPWATWAHGDLLVEPDVDLEYTVTWDGERIIYEIGVPMFYNYGGRSGDETVVTELWSGGVIGFDIIVDTRHSAGFGMLSENGVRSKYINADYFAKYVLKYVLVRDPCIPDDMVLIPGGTFRMGDNLGDTDWYDETPVHTVTVDSFYMGSCEVTNGQYCDYLNSALGQGLITITSGVVYKPGSGTTYPYCNTSAGSSDSQIAYSGSVFSVRTKNGRDMSNDPMVDVSWYGAVAYCNWRSEQEGYEECYSLSTWDCNFSKHAYRLATEAEWEYAARGGLSGRRFPWGDTISHSQANYSSGSRSWDVSPTSGYHPDWDDVYPYTSPGGTFAANGYGLYDMTGNVYEWCYDRYNPYYYEYSPTNNPTGPDGYHPYWERYHVLRGSSWAGGCRVAMRTPVTLDRRDSKYGFRLVLDFQ